MRIFISIGTLLLIGMFIFIYIVPRETKMIRLGFTHETLEALSIIASEKGFFKEQNLQVIIKPYDVGKFALEGLLKKEIDIAGVANTPMVISYLENAPIRTLAVMGRSDDQLKILGKRSRGIRELTDLKGKTILVQKGSAAHYFLSQVLDMNLMGENDVTLVFSDDVSLFPKQIVDKKIDSLCIKEPVFSKAQNALGSDAVIFQPKKVSFKTFNYVIHDNFLQKNPQTTERFLRALYQAEQFMQDKPDEALKIMMQYQGVDTAILQTQWSTQHIELVLDDINYTLLEDQATWAQSSGLISKTNVKRNIKDLIYSKSLRTVKPHGVYIDF